MNEYLERLVRIEEQNKAIKETLDSVVSMQRQQGETISGLKTDIALIKNQPNVPSVSKVTTFSTTITTTIIGIVIGVIEYLKQ